MAEQTDSQTHTPYCRAVLNYALEIGDVDPIEVAIDNAREISPDASLSWSGAGFELLKHTSAVSDWLDQSCVEQTYYAEMEDMAKQLTGCDHALIAGHIIRNPSAAAMHQDYAPIEFVHSDFTDSYGQNVRNRYLDSEAGALAALARAGIDAAKVYSAKRILILQFWRNIGAIEMDRPLAFCDTRSVPAEDLVAFHVPEYGGQADPFDTFAVTRPAVSGAHRWYVFPQMTAQEVVAFRTYDSELANNGGHYWTPHSAFTDPVVLAPKPRHSIEVRATCLFG